VSRRPIGIARVVDPPGVSQVSKQRCANWKLEVLPSQSVTATTALTHLREQPGERRAMRETFHLVLAVAALGVFLLAMVSMPRVERAASQGGRVAVLRALPQRQQLLLAASAVARMYGPAAQRRQSLLSTVSEIDRALGSSEDGYRENRKSIGRVQATGVRNRNLDEGLPTLTSGTIWSRGSPQNQGEP
jgi:hypothetical protein